MASRRLTTGYSLAAAIADWQRHSTRLPLSAPLLAVSEEKGEGNEGEEGERAAR